MLDESDAPPTYRHEVLDKTPTITKRSRGRERAAARREQANAASSTSAHSPQSKAEDEAKVGAEAEEAEEVEAEAEAMPPWKVEMLAKRRTKQATAQATPSKPEGAPLGVGRAADLPDLPDLRIDLPTALRDLRAEMAAASFSSKQLDCIEVRRAYSTYPCLPPLPHAHISHYGTLCRLCMYMRLRGYLQPSPLPKAHPVVCHIGRVPRNNDLTKC